MKTVIKTKEEITSLTADMICELVGKKPDAVLAFSVGRTQAPLFEELIKRETSFKNTTLFAVCEYAGLPEEDENSLGGRLKALAEKLGTDKIFIPGEENADRYDDMIRDCGGIDLCVLGIGINGHIGFNEPGSFYDSHTRKVMLTDSTRRMKAEQFGGFENVSVEAYTMGIKTICSAKNVILSAFGEEKADVVFKLVYGKTESYVPAAMLQMHMNMTLLLDSKASSKLD